MTGFSYRSVWTPTLTSKRVIVHDPGHWNDRNQQTWTDDGKRYEVWRTHCGLQKIARFVSAADTNRPLAADDYGVHLLEGHADRIGAHFCRRCYDIPEGANVP